MTDQCNVVVVGGGIWGFSTAWHLAKAGVEGVCVIEQNPEAARETTPRAAGLVGQIRSSQVMCDAIRYGLDLFEAFPEETGHDPGLHRTGSLLLALNERRMQAYQDQVQRANDNGVEASFVSHQEIRRLAPEIDISSVVGGYFVPGDGYLDPRQCALAFADAAVDRGVDVRYGTQVSAIEVDDERVRGVSTANGDIRAEHVVITAGPWTGQLAALTGYNPPMQTIRHQRVRTTAADGIPEHHPVVRVTDVSCYVRPEQGGYLYGFFEPQPTAIDLDSQPGSFRTDDLDPPIETMDEARRRLAPVFPVLDELDVSERIQGVTTFAPDGQYLIGPVPGIRSLHAASGCAALGIAGSAAVGSWIAEFIATGERPEALQHFNPLRFGEQAANRDWVRQASLDFYGNYYSLVPGQSDDASS